MSHTSPNVNQQQSLPVLKNFNAFNILEPQKVNLENTNVSTAILVDVSDGKNKMDKSLELSPDLHGSFLDKVSDFDLLDLYQNIYVTPQHIKKEPCYDKNKNSCPDDPFKVDFTELLEKAEKGKKLSEWKNDENTNSIKLSEWKNYENTNSIKLSEWKNDENTNSIKLSEWKNDENTNSLKLSEWKNDENTNSIKLSEWKNDENTNSVKLSEWKYDENTNSIKNTPRVNLTNNPRSLKEILDNAISLKCSKLAEPLPLDVPESDPICEDDIDDFLQPKLFIDQSVFKQTTQVSSSATSHLKSLSQPIDTFNTAVNDRPLNVSKISSRELETQKSLYCVDEITQVSHSVQKCHLYENKIKNFSKSECQSDMSPIYLNEIKTSLTDLNSPSVNHIACQTEKFPLLHTVKLDPKVYDKRRIVKNDAEKIGFIKGPDIYEKSKVLPQIMRRLAERKQALDQQQSVQRMLMLETSVTCNKMHNYDISRGIDRVTNTAQVSIKSEPSNKHAIYPTSDRVLKDLKSTELTAYQKPEGFCNVSKYKEPTKLTAFLKPSEYPKLVPLKPPAYFLEPEASASLKPEVLMEDCSSKRVKALKARLAFEKFVYTGKLPP